MANPANPREFEADFESRGGDIERATEQLKGMGESAARVAESVDRVGKEATEMGREVLKFQKALFKAGASLAKSEAPFEELMKQDKELSRQKVLLAASIAEQTRLLSMGVKIDQDLLDADKKLLVQKNDEIAKNRLEKLYHKDKKPGEEKGEGLLGNTITKISTWAETAVLGMFVKIGAEIGGYVLNRLDQFKEGVWEANAKSREGAKITGNIFASGSDVNRNRGQDDKMRVLVESLGNSKLLRLFGMDKDAIAGIDTYGRAYNKGEAFKNLDKGGVEEKLEHLGVVAVATGLGFKKTLEEVTTASRKYNLGETESINLLVWATDQEKKKGLAEGELINNYKSLQSSLAMFGFNIYQSAGMADKFGKALQEGKIGLGEIVNYAKGIQNAGLGETYVVLEAASKGGGKSAAMIRDAMTKYTNPIALVEWARGFSQDDPLSRKMFDPHGKISVNQFSMDLNKAARGMMPTSNDPIETTAMLNLWDAVVKNLGISNVSNIAKKRELLALGGDTLSAKISEPIGYGGGENALSLIGKKLGSEIGPWEKLDNTIRQGVTEIVEAVNHIIFGNVNAEDLVRSSAISLRQYGTGSIVDKNMGVSLENSYKQMERLPSDDRTNYRLGMAQQLAANPGFMTDLNDDNKSAKNIIHMVFKGLDEAKVIGVLQGMKTIKKSELNEWRHANHQLFEDSVTDVTF